MASILGELSQAVIRGDAAAVKEFTEKTLAQGIAPERIFREALIPGMDEVAILTQQMSELGGLLMDPVAIIGDIDQIV